MRLFFALDLPGQLALDIADWRERSLPLPGRPVPVANFHMTLAFLGEVPESELDSLVQDVDALASKPGIAGGALQLDQVGFWSRPGIYWLGPREWPQSLERLARKLRNLVGFHGDQKRRESFQPHVTLFRGGADAPPPPANPPDFVLPYREFVLMESRQGKRGVTYQPVADWDLAHSHT